MNAHPSDPDGPTTPPTESAVDPDRQHAQHPPSIGGYEILRPLGEGGMGMVYEAQQENPHRKVALKVIRAGLANPQLIRRFELESQVLARLQHPGIAQVYEAGTAETGGAPQAFFAMELIRGRNLLEHADHFRLDLRQRLRLIARVCDAVHHAHLRGVIHRDLKPGNILVTEPATGDVGQPKVLDFGVARLTDADIQMTIQKTDIGQIIGTLPYMSPEQVSGDPDALDVRSDVYALGVILYQILSGEMPLNLSSRQLPEVVRAIQEDEPSSLSQHDQRLRGDVEVIVGKALEKEKDRRYQSAEELADDIRRFLEDRPIEARPPSTAYQLRKFARRNRALVGGVITAFVLLVAGTTASTWQAFRATRAEKLAAEEAAASQRVSEFLADMLGDVDPERLGNTLVDDLRERILAQQEKKGRSPDEIAAVDAEFDRLLNGVNRTDLASGLLDAEILARADQSIATELSEDPVIAARLYQTLGDTYYGLSLYDESMAEYQKAQEIRAWELGDDDAATLESRLGHAQALSRSRATDPLQDLSLFEEIHQKQREALGPDHPQTMETLAKLARLEQIRGNRAIADSLGRIVLDAQMKQSGPRHPATLEAAAELGTTLEQMDLMAEAESLKTYAYETAQEVLGPEDPRTLDLGYDLALMWCNSDEYMMALELNEANAEIRERIQGRLHAKTLQEKRRIIHAHTDHLYRSDVAASLYPEIIEAQRERGGMGDRVAAEDALALVGLLMDLDHPERADSVFTDTMGHVERQHGVLDRENLLLRYQWAGYIYGTGQREKALEQYRLVLSQQEELLDPWHMDLSNTAFWTARVLNDLERCDEAEPYWLRSLEIATRDDPEGLATNRSLIWTAVSYMECENLEAAVPLFRRAVELAVIRAGTDSRDEAWTKSMLASALLGQGKVEEARPYYDDFVRIYRELGEGRPRLLNFLCDTMLVEDYEVFLDEELLMQVVRDMNEALNHEEPWGLVTLAKVHARFDRPEEAADAMRRAIELLPAESPDQDNYRQELAEYETVAVER